MRQLLPHLQEECGISLSVSTLRRLARRLGFVWKRCRRSLRAQRDPLAFAACQHQLAALHQAQQRGEVAVYYGDECRFSRQAPVPYAWQRRGQPPVELPAVRGAGGHSVLGFWPAGVAGQKPWAWQRAGSFTADLFVLALDEFSQDLPGPTVLVLDNASIHKAHCVQARRAEWAARGLTLLFLPPYSPELNRIELLWHRGKHYTAASTTGCAPKITAPTTASGSASSTCSNGWEVTIRLLLPNYLRATLRHLFSVFFRKTNRCHSLC